MMGFQIAFRSQCLLHILLGAPGEWKVSENGKSGLDAKIIVALLNLLRLMSVIYVCWYRMLWSYRLKKRHTHASNFEVSSSLPGVSRY